jgi:peptidoglycan/xylan/chitin deacetylase (PgdA/CDA1 family)
LFITQPWTNLVNDLARRVVRPAAGLFCRPPAAKEWIVFQYYHWVLDDEREAFRRQLRFLPRYGDFISLDDAVAALQSPSGIGGRYFCITFDDGFQNCFTNAVPILKELNVPAAFFLPTKYIGLDLDADWQEIQPFYNRCWGLYSGYFDFLNWEECRLMASTGFTLGSHTHSHHRLTSLGPGQAEEELIISKQIIEEQVGLPCRHFCCPWGKPHRDFDPDLHPDMSRRYGYSSFLTTEVGWNLPGQSAYDIARISITAGQGPLTLRYSLFASSRQSGKARSGVG